MVDLPEDLEKLARELPPFMSVNKTMDVAQCCRATLYKRLHQGRYAAVKDGRKTKIITSTVIRDMASLPAAEFGAR
jgi:hypothetical protein